MRFDSGRRTTSAEGWHLHNHNHHRHHHRHHHHHAQWQGLAQHDPVRIKPTPRRSNRVGAWGGVLSESDNQVRIQHGIEQKGWVPLALTLEKDHIEPLTSGWVRECLEKQFLRRWRDKKIDNMTLWWCSFEEEKVDNHDNNQNWSIRWQLFEILQDFHIR